MDVNVKRLVVELPDIVQRNTKRSYDDVQNILTLLQKYVKRPMAAKSGVLKKLDELEALLSTKYQEKNQNISKHTQKIRQILDVGMKGNSGNTSSSENNRISDVLTGSGATDTGMQKLRPSSGIVGGRAGNVIPDAAGQKARPNTGIPGKKASRATSGDYRNRISRSSGFQVEKTNEMLFLEDCLIHLKGMFNDDIKDNEEIIPAPKKNIMETVRTVHTYLGEVAGKIRRLKFENQHMKMILSGLHKNMIGGEENPQMDLKPPKDMQNDLSTMELERNAKTITQTFNELKTASENIKGERKCMLSILDALHNETQHLAEGKPHNDMSVLVGEITSSVGQESASYEMVRKAVTISDIQMEWKREIGKLQKEKDSLQSKLDGLPTEIKNPTEGKTHDDVSSQLDQADSSRRNDSTNQESSIQSGASGSAAKGSNEMNEHLSGDTEEEDKNADSEPQTKQLSTTDKKKSKNKRRGKHTEQMQPLGNIEQIRINPNNASSVLDDKTDVGKLQKEKDSLQSKLDGLPTEITNPTEGRTHDQVDSSISNDSTNQDSFLQSGALASSFKGSNEMKDHLSRDSQKETNNAVSEPQPKKTSMTEKRKPKDKRKDKHTEQMQLSRNFEQLRKSSDNASSVLEEKPIRVDLITKTEQLEDMSRKHKHLSEHNSELVKQVDSLRSRLSELAGAKLTHDNASIADLSDPNRPTKLAEMYSELYSNQWTDALEELSKINKKESEETLICYLYDILKDGYYFCREIRDKQKSKLAEIMFDPAKCTERSEAIQKNEVSEIFAKHLSEAAKLSSNMASSNIAKGFVAKKQTERRYKRIMEPCRIYIEECVKLCWHMQVQTPPVCIDLETAKGQSFVKGMYREYTAKGQKIAYVVWPALFLHDKGPMLIKGIAQGE